MKKTQKISLVLITAALASCHRPGSQWDEHSGVYIRSDSTAPYTNVYHHHGVGLWYYAFRPYGDFAYGPYRRAGYYSDAISESSNVGFNSVKSGIIRGGFGSSSEGGGGFSVSS